MFLLTSIKREETQTIIDVTFGALNDTNIDYIVDYVVHDVHVGRPTRFSVSLNGKVQISHREAHNRLNCGKLQVSCEGLGVEFLPNVNIGTLAVTSNACDVLSWRKYKGSAGSYEDRFDVLRK